LCVCIPVSQIHNILNHGYRRAKQFREGAGGKTMPECSKQSISKKRSSLKCFLFSRKISVKKVFFFRFAGIFSNFLGYAPDLSG